MSQYCYSCLKVSSAQYCKKCATALFGTYTPPEQLSFIPNQLMPSEANRYKKGLSISGVQAKYSFAFRNNILELVQNEGRYIVKPIPNANYDYLSDMPANEHITMQIAHQVFKMKTALNAMVRLGNGELAYITKRFDYDKLDNKLRQEDFTVLVNQTEQSYQRKLMSRAKSEEIDVTNYKYDYSVIECARAIDDVVPSAMFTKLAFFKRILFDFLMLNADAHLKNFSLYCENDSDEYQFTPNYDLLNSRLHLGKLESTDIALNIFEDDETTQVYDAVGFYTYIDFQELALLMKIRPAQFKKIIKEFSKSLPAIKVLVDRSFLSDEAKRIYFEQVEKRLHQCILYVPERYKSLII
jgi:serine/threonine-protein kinase HipA